jgi:hypothetical protein
VQVHEQLHPPPPHANGEAHAAGNALADGRLGWSGLLRQLREQLHTVAPREMV